MNENLTLGNLTQFVWHRSGNAFWANWRDREAHVPWHAVESAPGVWKTWLTESAADYALNPWMIVHRGDSYQPLREESALFQKFAALPVDRDSYLEFAQRYGALTGHHELDLPDRLFDWIAEHYRMKRAVLLLDALKNQTTDDLRALGIQTTEARHVNGSPLPPWFSMAYLAFGGTELGTILEDGSAAEQPAIVSAAVYRALGNGESGVVVHTDSGPRNTVQAVLVRTVTDALARHRVAPTLEPDGTTLPNASGLRLSFEVKNLAGAMWLQLLLAVDENRTYRTCPVCGEWWDATGARRHKEVCSDKCRAKRSYQKRKSAGTGDSRSRQAIGGGETE